MQKNAGVKHLLHCSEETLEDHGVRKLDERESKEFSKPKI